MSSEQARGNTRESLSPELQAAFDAAGKNSLGVVETRLKEAREKRGIPAPVVASVEAAPAVVSQPPETKKDEPKVSASVAARVEPAPVAAPATPDEPGGKLIAGRRRAAAKPELKPEDKLSSKERAQISLAIPDLESQKNDWISRIDKADSQEKFSKITQDAASKSGEKWTTVPGFVTGDPLRDILKRYKITSDAVTRIVREKASDIQKEIGDVYLAKKAELSSSAAEEKEKENVKTITDRLTVSRDHWTRGSLKDARHQGDLDKILRGIPGKLTPDNPRFIKGELDDLLKQFPVQSDAHLKELQEMAQEFQQQVSEVYNQKIEEIKRKEAADREAEKWTKEKLLAEIQDGEEFVLVGEKSASTRRKYKRDGDDILNSKGEVATDKALDQLNKGWSIEAKEGKKEDFFLEKEDEPILFVGNNNSKANRWNRVLRKGNEYFFLSHGTDTLSPAHTEEQIRNLAKKEEWKVVTDDTEYKEAMGLSPKKDSDGFSPEERQLLNQMIVDLKGEADLWVANIRSTLSLSGLDELKPDTDVPAEMSRKYADSLLNSVKEIHSHIPDKMKGDLSDKANHLAEQIAREYLDKKQRLEEQAAPLDTKVKTDVEEGVFYKLKIGERTQYLSKEDVHYTVEKRAGGYFIQDADGGWDGPHKSSILAYKAKDEGWVLVEEEPLDTVAAPKGIFEFKALSEGESASYSGTNGEVTVTREGNMYQITDAAGEASGFVYDEARIQSIAQVEEWVAVDGTIRPVSPEKNALQEKIEQLKIKVAEFRQKYAEVDYEKTSAWKNLSGFFRNLSSAGKRDADSEYWNSEYHTALTELKELELQQLKESGLQGKEMKNGMAGLLQYYMLEEGRALYDARTQVRLERQGKFAKALGWYEEKIKDYGKLSWKTKIGVSLALLGLAGATGGVSLVARRILSGSSAAVGIDALLEKGIGGLEKWHTTKGINKIIEGGADIQELEDRLSREIAALSKNLRKKKQTALYRKTASFLIGVVAGSASSLIGAHHDAPPKGGAPGGAPQPAPTPAPVASGATPSASEAASAPRAPGSVPGLNPQFDLRIPGSIADAAAQASGSPAIVGQGMIPEGRVPGMAAVEGASPEPQPALKASPIEKTPAVPAEKVPEKALEDYKVKAMDGKRGLWGILEKRFIPDDTPKAESNRIVQSLENLMQQKLDDMSPAEQKAAGFPTGKIDMIQRGGTIHFDKLLSAEEIQEVIDGKDIEAPEAPKVAPSPPLDNNRTGVPDLKSNPPVAEPASASAPVESADKQAAARAKEVAAYDVERRLSDPKEFLKEHPELRNKLFSAVGKLRMEIFMTRDIEDLTQYNYAEHGLGKTVMSQVYNDARMLKSSPFTGYDRISNPLHYSQMLRLSKFMDASIKVFGSGVGAPGAGESIDAYTSRMATMAVRTGKAIKGFYKP